MSGLTKKSQKVGKRRVSILSQFAIVIIGWDRQLLTIAEYGSISTIIEVALKRILATITET